MLLTQVISFTPYIHVLYVFTASILLSHVEHVGLAVDHILDGLVREYIIIQGVTAHPLKNKRICLALKAQQPVTSAVLRLWVFRSIEHHGKQLGQHVRVFRGLLDVELGAAVIIKVVI